MNDENERREAEWQETLKRIPPLAANGNKWPHHVRPITIDELDLLGVDGDGTFYWDGKVVTIQKHITLTFGQKVWATLVGLASLLVFLSTVAQGVASYNQWACTVNWYAVCPSPPS